MLLGECETIPVLAKEGALKARGAVTQMRPGKGNVIAPLFKQKNLC